MRRIGLALQFPTTPPIVALDPGIRTVEGFFRQLSEPADHPVFRLEPIS